MHGKPADREQCGGRSIFDVDSNRQKTERPALHRQLPGTVPYAQAPKAPKATKSLIDGRKEPHNTNYRPRKWQTVLVVTVMRIDGSLHRKQPSPGRGNPDSNTNAVPGGRFELG